MIVTRAGINKHREKDKIIDIEFLSNEYIFQFFKTATLFYIDGKEVRANPNTVIIHNRNHPRKFKTLDFEMQNDYVCFYTDDSDLEGIPFSTPISVTDTEFFHNVLTLIYNEVYNNVYQCHAATEALVKALLAKTRDAYEQSSKKTTSSKLSHNLIQLKDAIHAYPRENWTIDKMAEECNVSASRFYVIYKKQFGITPIQEVICARINMAKRLLASTELSIKGISGYCGYKSVSHFINHFKKETGLTPAKYRNSI